jgi:hypothetical protein
VENPLHVAPLSSAATVTVTKIVNERAGALVGEPGLSPRHGPRAALSVSAGSFCLKAAIHLECSREKAEPHHRCDQKRSIGGIAGEEDRLSLA